MASIRPVLDRLGVRRGGGEEGEKYKLFFFTFLSSTLLGFVVVSPFYFVLLYLYVCVMFTLIERFVCCGEPMCCSLRSSAFIISITYLS
jgi:hypothetical protein